MALWEYKVITSGLHGFASPSLLEAHLNALGKDDWEIVHFQTLPNNVLAFHGLARRATVRDWTPPIEVPAPAPMKSAYEPAPAVTKPTPATAPAAKSDTESLASRLGEKQEVVDPSREESLRPMRNTERDLDQDTEEEEGDGDWDDWEDAEDDLPTLFEALKPHFRRNQKGVGMSVAVDYLAKRWEQRENDLIGALKECGFSVPEKEEDDPEYFEFEGDLYWINRNNRGQLFINSREKPRPAFRVTQAKKLDPNDPAAIELAAERTAEKAEIEKRKSERLERAERQTAAKAQSHTPAIPRENGPAIADQPDSPDGSPTEAKPSSDGPAAPLPTGQALLDKIRPMMRRNRRGPGYSGSVGFLARALKHSEADLTAVLAALDLHVPANAADKPIYVEITDGVYWMNKDSRGGIWINGREKREGDQKSEAKSEGSDSSLSPNEAAAAADRLAENAPGAEPVTAGVGDGAAASENSPSSTSDSPISQGEHDAKEKSGDESTSASSGSIRESQESTPSRRSTSDIAVDGAPIGGVEPEGESARAAKTGKPRKPSSRPRTRKVKSDTDSASAPGSENESANSDETPKQE